MMSEKVQILLQVAQRAPASLAEQIVCAEVANWLAELLAEAQRKAERKAAKAADKVTRRPADKVTR